MAEKTKKLREWKCFWLIVSVLLTVAPIVFFFIAGLCDGSISVAKKFGLSSTIVVVLAISALGILRKHQFKCVIWVFLLAAYAFISKFGAVLITMGVCSILDEIVALPMYRRCKLRYNINKEIDER